METLYKVEAVGDGTYRLFYKRDVTDINGNPFEIESRSRIFDKAAIMKQIEDEEVRKQNSQRIIDELIKELDEINKIP